MPIGELRTWSVSSTNSGAVVGRSQAYACMGECKFVSGCVSESDREDRGCGREGRQREEKVRMCVYCMKRKQRTKKENNEQKRKKKKKKKTR